LGCAVETNGIDVAIALSQGIAFIQKYKDGSLKVTNPYNNTNFFLGVVPKLKGMGKSLSKSEMGLGDIKQGAVDLDSYTSILRKLNE
jgi:hypothetical protein